jgi:hypothetical protein
MNLILRSGLLAASQRMIVKGILLVCALRDGSYAASSG